MIRVAATAMIVSALLVAAPLHAANWYESSFYMLHEDHHTVPQFAVGRDADPAETERLIALSHPDVIQIHAKGNPGWTTYPSKVGFTPLLLARDVLGLWESIARRDGYHFSVYFNIGRDGEIMKRHPEWNRVKANGKLYERALCYQSGVAQGYLWPMIDEILAKYHPDGFWFDGSCFTVTTCYCAQCRARFRRETGLEAPRSPKDPGWAAYKEMQRQIYREFIHNTIAHIKQQDPKCLVAFNWAYALRMPETPDPGIDYLTGDDGDNVGALAPDACWYDSQNRPFDLMTTIFTANGAPKPDGQIEQEMAIIIANGGRYWAWDDPTPESGLVANRMEMLGRVVSPFLRQRQQGCLGSRRLPDVSLLHSAVSHYAITANSPAVFPRQDPPILAADQGLRELHLNHEMISDDRLAKLDIRSPALLVEDPAALSGEDCKALDRFVSGGGTLLVTGNGVVLPALADLLGVTVVSGAPSPENWQVELDGKKLPLRQRVIRMRLAGATQLLAAKDASGDTAPLLTEHHAGKGRVLCVPFPLFTPSPDCTVPPQFQEYVLREAAPLAQRLITTDAPPTVDLILRSRGDERILHLVNMAAGKRELTGVRPHQWMRITDIPPAPPCHVSILLPHAPQTVTLQPQGTALNGWTYRKERLEVDVPGFAIHQMVVVQSGK